MAEYTKDLEEMHPATGRYIKEDGTTANLADCVTTDSNGNIVYRAVSST